MKNSKITDIMEAAMHNLPRQNFLQTALMSFLILGAAYGDAIAQDQTDNVTAEQVQMESPVEDSVVEAAGRQAIARQSAQDIAKDAAIAAADYFAQGEFQKSAAKYLEAINTLSDADPAVVAPDYVASQIELAKKNLANVYYCWSQSLFLQAEKSANIGSYDDAIDKCQKAMEIYPPSKPQMEEAIDRYTKMKEAAAFRTETSYSRIDPDAEGRAYRTSILLEQGRVLYKSGRYDRALDKFVEVLSYDPYNQTAIDFQRKIYLKLKDLGEMRRETASFERLAEIAWVGVRPISLAEGEGGDDITVMITKIDSTKDIQKKLTDIQLDHLSFSQEPIDSVISTLRRISRDNDTQDHQGVNFVLRFSTPDYQGMYGVVPDPAVTGRGQGPMRPTDPDAIYNATHGGGGVNPADPMARFRQPAARPSTPSAPARRSTDPDAIYDASHGGGGRPNPADPMARFRNNGGMPGGMPGGFTGEDMEVNPQEDFLITVDLDNISLGDAIDSICRSANLQYRIEENAVVIAAPDVPMDDFDTVIYPIEEEMLGMLDGDYSKESIETYFMDRGIPFPEGAKCVYDPAISRLIVTNTPQNLDKIAEIINEMNVMDPSVLVNVRFVEVDASDLQELGFEYTFSRQTGGTEGSGSSVTFGPNSQLVRNIEYNYSDFGLTSAENDVMVEWGHTDPKRGYEYNAKLHALDMADSTEVLSTPRVTTMNGQQATIRMVTEKYYPDDWSDPEVEILTQDNESWLVFTASTPEYDDVSTEGMIFTIRPFVDENFYITMAINPVLKTFLGWTDYSYSIPLVAGNDVVYFENTLIQKIMEVKGLETVVTTYDGQTVVLGGIVKDDIVEVDDQYPILGDLPLVGRLFQSKGRRDQKVNMLIFVTNTLVNPDGTPLRENEARGIPVIR